MPTRPPGGCRGVLAHHCPTIAFTVGRAGRSCAPAPGTSGRRSASPARPRSPQSAAVPRCPPGGERSAPRSGCPSSPLRPGACARRPCRPCRGAADRAGSGQAGARPHALRRRGRSPPRSSGARPPPAHPWRASGSGRCRRRSAPAALPHRRLKGAASSPYPGQMPIRIVVAEDHYLVREGLRRLLETQDELEVASVCGDLDSLLEAVEVERPDVVVTDIRMPPGNTDEGIQAATRLRASSPDVGVVVLSQYAVPSYVLALLDGGSERRAYLLKERVDDVDQLVAAIRTVAAGGSVLDPKVVEALVAENARSEDSPLNELTPRERDVLREMAEGKNNAAIAASLFLTERSVEKVIHSIFLKLGLTWETAVHKRVKAVVLYLAESG